MKGNHMIKPVLVVALTLGSLSLGACRQPDQYPQPAATAPAPATASTDTAPATSAAATATMAATTDAATATAPATTTK